MMVQKHSLPGGLFDLPGGLAEDADVRSHVDKSFAAPRTDRLQRDAQPAQGLTISRWQEKREKARTRMAKVLLDGLSLQLRPRLDQPLACPVFPGFKCRL